MHAWFTKASLGFGVQWLHDGQMFSVNIINKLWRPIGQPHLDLLMWKSTVLLRANLKHMKHKMTVVFHFYTAVVL